MWVELENHRRIPVGVLEKVLWSTNRLLKFPELLWLDMPLNQGLLVSCVTQVCYQDVGRSHKCVDGHRVDVLEVQDDCRVNLPLRRVQLRNSHRSGIVTTPSIRLGIAQSLLNPCLRNSLAIRPHGPGYWQTSRE